MATTATPTPTLPTQAELDEAIKVLAACAQPLARLSGKVLSVADVDMDEDPVDEPARGPAPTFEQIGQLYCFNREALGQLEELSNYIATIEESVRDLDYLRIVRTRKLNRQAREARSGVSA
jgi:hypothetical protein